MHGKPQHLSSSPTNCAARRLAVMAKQIANSPYRRWDLNFTIAIRYKIIISRKGAEKLTPVNRIKEDLIFSLNCPRLHVKMRILLSAPLREI
jgi:hypothetical protein